MSNKVKKDYRTALRISLGLYQKLQTESQTKGMSVSKLIRIIIVKHFKEKEKESTTNDT